MDGHSGKAGLGLGLLLGRLATGSDPGVSSLHVLMHISHGAHTQNSSVGRGLQAVQREAGPGHGVHLRGDANGIRVQLPPIGHHEKLPLPRPQKYAGLGNSFPELTFSL